MFFSGILFPPLQKRLNTLKAYMLPKPVQDKVRSIIETLKLLQKIFQKRKSALRFLDNCNNLVFVTSVKHCSKQALDVILVIIKAVPCLNSKITCSVQVRSLMRCLKPRACTLTVTVSSLSHNPVENPHVDWFNMLP